MGGERDTYGEKRGDSRVWLEHLRERDHLEEFSVNGRIKLKWTYKRQDWVAQTRLIWLRVGTGGGHL
jgi:hypothetical protein